VSLTITALEDAKLLLEINNAAVPSVNELTLTKAEWKIAHLVTPGLALLDGKPAGVVAVFGDDSGYDSDYFRWFSARYENFLYIDRVIVADWARGQGVARALYEAVDRVAQERRLAIVADVYSQPPNEPSLALHRALGYQEVGSQYFPDIRKLCAKFMKYAEYAKSKT
jgi:predicted GNAT superfamily acetyltransferase